MNFSGTKFSCVTSPPTQHLSVVRKLTIQVISHSQVANFKMCSQSVVANWQVKNTAYLQSPLKLNQVSQADALDFGGRRCIYGPRNSN